MRWQWCPELLSLLPAVTVDVRRGASVPLVSWGWWEGMSGRVSPSPGHGDSFGRGVAQALVDGWSPRPRPSSPGEASVVVPALIPPLLLSPAQIFNRQLRSVCCRGETCSAASQRAAGERAHLSSQTCTSSCMKVSC